MSADQNKPGSAQRQREQADPNEGVRPLPWFLVMLLGAMAMWGGFYITTTPSGENSSYGDQRTSSALRPAVADATGGKSKVDGAQVFTGKCAACHQASGLGVPGVFPPLAGAEWVLGDEKTLINILLHGVSGPMEVKGVTYNGAMPPWNSLSDEELAAVMTYIRSNWGNQAAAVSVASVKAQRDATQARTEPYKGGEELKSAP